tara:strand:+ start:2467 stop:3114 length:648 start_codon:yes stop_codon:yes gene_type:complete
MAITVTEILGTDSLSGSRLVINDNFSILAGEINAIENYFNPTAGTITNLNDVRTESLRVGLSTVLLDINAATFDILTNVAVNNGNVSLNGGNLVRNNIDPTVLNDTNVVSPYGIGTDVAVPTYTTERIGANVSPVVLELFDGSIGQEIFFVYSDATANTVTIQAGSNTSFILNNSVANTIVLDAQGQTAHFMCIDDGTGNGDWYLVGGDGYTISA